MDYLYYSAEDFALDPSFRQWVQHPNDPAHRNFWETWLVEHPHKRLEVEQARQLVVALQEPTGGITQTEKQALWTRIQTTLSVDAVDDSNSQEDATMGRSMLLWPVWRKVAAAAILVMMTTLAWWSLRPSVTTVQTSFGTTRQVVLPDSSVVTLNGNSKLTYASVWSADHPREVSLEGEAFFSVTHTYRKGNARFLVHTNGLTVEVLGTQFNVSQRGAQARVVLTSGQVKLNIAKQKANLYMRPGEVVEWSEPTGKVTHKVADPTLYTSWKSHKLIFDETPLTDIAKILQHTYGRKMVFQTPDLAHYQISGTIPSDNVDMLLEALARSSHLQIKQQSDTILIENSESDF